jgi:hypothetical protein
MKGALTLTLWGRLRLVLLGRESLRGKNKGMKNSLENSVDVTDL